MQTKPLTRILRLEIGAPKKPKARPRGDPSAIKAYQFKKGHVLPKRPQKRTPDFMSKAYRVELDQAVPPEIAAALGLKDCTWAQAIAFAMVRRAASGDTAAAREIREVTEGRLPSPATVEGETVINYSGGRSAKVRLTAKLLGGCDAQT